jgi:hypothetical protein
VAIEEQTATTEQLSEMMGSIREYASETYAEMIENFRSESEEKTKNIS